MIGPPLDPVPINCTDTKSPPPQKWPTSDVPAAPGRYRRHGNGQQTTERSDKVRHRWVIDNQ